MPISQDDRIAISKKIVQIPKQDAQATKIQSQLEDAKIAAQKEDGSNKTLMDDLTPLINLYQQELERYDGNGRNQLVEQDMIDSAKHLLRNPFFPNDPQTLLPNIADGVWKNFPAFSGNKAIGKQYAETYTTIPKEKEQDLIDAVNTAILAIEAFEVFSDATRSSGNELVDSGTCSNPIYTDQATCELNGGVWTPGPYITTPSTAMASAGNDLINAIQAWEDFLNGTYAVVPTGVQDTDVARSAGNDGSRDDITNTISVIDTWQALQDYDTVTPTPTTQPAFDNFASSNFQPSKFRDVEIQDIKNEITARQAFISSRITALESDTYLGSITQDFGSGEINATTGLYGKRFRIIDMRLNLMGGSLNKVYSAENGQKAQEEAKKSNANAATAYTSVVTASLFRSPSAGNANIHVLDASGFSVSDSAYVIAENQQEIAVTIVGIDGNRVTLDKIIPSKYRETDLARLYKVL